LAGGLLSLNWGCAQPFCLLNVLAWCLQQEFGNHGLEEQRSAPRCAFKIERIEFEED
jgi:hypothetical protein